MIAKKYWIALIAALLPLTQPLFAAGPAKPVAKPLAKPTASPSPSPTPVVLPQGVQKVVVQTDVPAMPEVTFYLRVPSFYSRTVPNRVVICFADDGMSGLECGKDFNTIADDRGWFILTVSFNPDPETPPVDYSDPSGFSGKAITDALDQIGKKYPIARDALLLQGFGVGGRFVQRYAMLQPEKVLALAVHSPSEYIAPDAKEAQFSWVVTSITSDPNANEYTGFVAKLREIGAKVIFRTYGEMARKVAKQVDSAEPDTLACTLFAFLDAGVRTKLGQQVTKPDADPIPATYAPGDFVGDLRSLRYYKANAPEVAAIPPEFRVDFPCEALAIVWGTQIDKIIVPTASPLNLEVPFYVRVPANYSPTTRYRVLFRCPVYNGIGVRCVSGYGKFQVFADQRGLFMIAPTFKQAREDTKDRSASYYYPETFSGNATLEALDLIARKYPIVTNNLLMQGMSGGAQFVHRFAIWMPERVSAVAVNSSSWFDMPREGSARIAWLITIGESDKSYANSLDFLDQLRKVGALPLFRSYVGMIHEGSSKVDDFDLLFLRFYDEVTRPQFNTGRPSTSFMPPIQMRQMPFVGDLKDWRFVKNDLKAVMRIGEDNVVYLPSLEVARFWSGKGADEDGGKPTGLRGASY